MAVCINKNSKEYKDLVKVFGMVLTDFYITMYNQKNNPQYKTEGYEIPSAQVMLQALNTNEQSRKDLLLESLDQNPFLSTEGIKKVLGNILVQYQGRFHINKGTTALTQDSVYSDVVNNSGLRNRVSIMYELAEKYPSIFTVEQSRKDVNLYTVKITDSINRIGFDTNNEEDLKNFLSETSDRKSLSKEKAQLFIQVLASKFKQAFNVDYEFITEQQALEMSKYMSNTYKGQSAFFWKNKVYFVNDKFDLSDTLHEYSHVFIKGIRQYNIDLFNKLYESLPQEYKDSVNTINYTNLEDAKEEAIVMALEKNSLEKLKAKDQNAYNNFLANLFYAIRKLLRIAIQKVRLSELTMDTTIDKLSTMLLDESFTIVETIKPVDTAMFKTELESIISEFKKAGEDILLKTINRTYEESKYQLNSLNAAPWKLKKDLIGKDGSNILRYIREELNKYQTIDLNNPTTIDLQNIINSIKDSEEVMRLRTTALVKSINDIEVFVENIEKNLVDLARQDEFTIDDANRINYFAQFLNEQKTFIEDLRKITEFSKNADFWKKLNSINDSIDNSKRKISKIEYEIVKDLIDKNTTGLNLEAEEQFIKVKLKKILKANKIEDSVIESYIDKILTTDIKSLALKDIPFNIDTFTKKEILALIKEYNAKKINLDVIDRYLKGEMPELGFFSAWITPYSNIDDPVISSTVRMLKESFSKAQAKSLKQYNDIGNRLQGYLKEVGWSKNDTGQLGKLLLDQDKIGIYEDGEVVEKVIYTFKNRFKNWRYDKAVLENNLQKALASQSKEDIKKAYEELRSFEEKYMHREYVPEYYQAQNIFNNENTVKHPVTGETITVSKELSQASNLERIEALSDLRTFTSKEFIIEDIEAGISDSDIARSNYNKLYDIYDVSGKLKKGDELLKTLVRLKHKNATSNFYESKIDDVRIQKDLNAYVNRLKSKPDFDESTLPMLINKWLDNNFQIAYTEKYYQDKNQAMETITRLSSKNPNAKALSDLYKQRYELAFKFIDKNRQPRGNALTPEEIDRLKDLEEQIIILQKDFDVYTGLTKEESDLYAKLAEKINDDTANTDEKNTFIALTNKTNATGLTKDELKQLNAAFAKLRDLGKKVPTEYYKDTIDSLLDGIYDFGVNGYNRILKDESLLESLFDQSEEFKEWFLKNHYSKSYVNSKGKTITEYYRLSAWTVNVASSEYLRTHVIIDPITGKEMTINKIPRGKYFRPVIKKEYKTGYNPTTGKVDLTVGVHIDNKGNFLPRYETRFDDKYINKEYETLAASNSAQYKLLEATKREYLKLQENAYRSGKMYLDLPRFRIKDNLEFIQSGQGRETLTAKAKGIGKAVKSTFTKAKDDMEQGFNNDISYKLVNTDISGEPVDRIPIRGMYMLDIEETSTDVLGSMYHYMHSLNEHEELVKIQPLTNALLNVLKDPENATKNLNEVSKSIYKGRNIVKYLNSKGNPRRAQAVEHLIEKAVYGRPNNEFMEEYPGFTKVAQKMMSAASRSFIMLNLTSALKNRYGMMFQSMLESAGGKFITPQSLAKGRVRSFKSMVEFSTKGIYSTGPKTLDVQIMENFDPITGKTKNDFGKSASRTFVKDLFNMTWLYDHRRFMEMEAGLQIFWAMMYKKDIEQIDSTGNIQKIKYADAFELDNEGNLQLKKGINPEYFIRDIKHVINSTDTYESLAKQYNTTVEALETYNGKFEKLEPNSEIYIAKSKEFFDFKLKIQGVGKMLNGQLDELDNPQADKYLGYRLFSFYKRFATGMFLNRFQTDMSKDNRWGHVYNADTNSFHKGFYIQGFQAIMKNIKSLGKNYKYMTDEEKQSVRKMAVEGMFIMILAFIASFLLGYDPDDEDRFEKLRARQKDDLGGYLANHLLYQLITVRSENQTFIPYLGFGEWIEFGKQTTIATGPTIELYSKILMDIYYMVTGDKRAYYKQDVGPYSWQEKESLKLYNHLASIFGFTGGNYDPVWAIKRFEQFKNLR